MQLLWVQEKHVIRRKKHFDENVDHEITQSVEESFRIDYFLFIVVQAISSIKQRFEQFYIYEELFGFLFSFKKLKSFDDDSLQDMENQYYGKSNASWSKQIRRHKRTIQTSNCIIMLI